MRAFKSGTDRGFSRLSDRVGAGRLNGLISRFSQITAGSGSLPVPEGATLAQIICLGAGGAAGGGQGGGGGGCAEYFLPVTDAGLALSYTVGNFLANSAGQNTTVTLPNGLGTVTGGGGQSGASGGSGGTGSGPSGTIVRLGGAPDQPGQNPFGGERGGGGTGSGGGGGGPIGGMGRNQNTGNAGPGGGGSTNSGNGEPGAVYILFFGVLP